MKGTSTVIMAATLIMVFSLAIVLSLILVLLAELYCSLLVRRRGRHTTTTTTTASEDVAATDIATAKVEAPTQLQKGQSSSSAPPLSRFYSHGVLNNAPRNILIPSLSLSPSSKHELELSDLEKNSQQQQLRQFLGAAANSTFSSSKAAGPLQVRVLSSSPPSPSPSNPAAGSELQAAAHGDANGSRSSIEHPRHLVYISNPIFDDNDEEHNHSSSIATTPYATPDTSPSRLGNTSGSSDEDEHDALKQHPLSLTPPLSPMRELPAEACSVSLKDTRCLNTTSGSDSNSINASGGSTYSSIHLAFMVILLIFSRKPV